MKIVYFLGNEILNKERDLKIFQASEKYDKAIELRVYIFLKNCRKLLKI